MAEGGEAEAEAEAEEAGVAAVFESLLEQSAQVETQPLQPVKKKKLKKRERKTEESETKVPFAHTEGRKPWDDEEDRRLLAAARAHGFTDGSKQGVWNPDWTLISEMVGTRKPKQCRERIFDNLDPSINHSALTAEEEGLLMQLVEAHGTKWAVIADKMPQTNARRPGNQLKNNWNRIMGKHKDRKRRRRSSTGAHTRARVLRPPPSRSLPSL